MNCIKINELVKDSYKNGYLDQKKVNKISSLIGRSDLKKYINGLKLAESKKNLIVSCPTVNCDFSKFKKLFPHEKIILKKDSSLMLGARVVDNDTVYEFTLKDSLDKIVNYIEQNYD